MAVKIKRIGANYIVIYANPQEQYPLMDEATGKTLFPGILSGVMQAEGSRCRNITGSYSVSSSDIIDTEWQGVRAVNQSYSAGFLGKVKLITIRAIELQRHVGCSTGACGVSQNAWLSAV